MEDNEIRLLCNEWLKTKAGGEYQTRYDAFLAGWRACESQEKDTNDDADFQGAPI